MFTWKRYCGTLAIELALASGTAWAQGHHHHHSAGAGGVPGGGLAAVGGGWAGYGFPFYNSIGPSGFPLTYVPPLLVFAPGGFSPMMGMGPLLMPPPALSRGVGVAGPWPPPNLARQALGGGWEPAKVKRAEPSRATQLVTYGDRHFRAGNVHRAAERYAQALSADPNSAAPRIRLAQIALLRGQYAEAADRYREATISEPGWLAKAPDIQAIYGEPSDFARPIAKLETHLQANPNDRDAWFVLGAQWYLSGQTRKASDVFLRLTDRKADASLAAFLDASTPQRPAPQ